MKFPLFSKRPSSPIVLKNTQAEVEKLLAESFRLLGQLFSKAAEMIEQDRLARSGYKKPDSFLERVDDHAPKDPK